MRIYLCPASALTLTSNNVSCQISQHVAQRWQRYETGCWHQQDLTALSRAVPVWSLVFYSVWSSDGLLFWWSKFLYLFIFKDTNTETCNLHIFLIHLKWQKKGENIKTFLKVKNEGILNRILTKWARWHFVLTRFTPGPLEHCHSFSRQTRVIFSSLFCRCRLHKINTR